MPTRSVRRVGGTGWSGFRRELLRKRIHIATAVVPAAVWFLPRSASLLLLAAGVILAFAIELARHRVRWVRYRFLRGTRIMLRDHERRRFAGATHMAVAYLLAMMIFPRVVAVTAMLYNALGDAAGAVVGRRWGRRRTSWGKSWEGAGAVAAVNLAIGVAMPDISPIAAVLGGLCGAALEFLPLPLDDNLRITLGGGLALWLGMMLG